MTTWNPTSAQLESHLTTCLTAAGYLEDYRAEGDFGRQIINRKAGSPIDFKITTTINLAVGSEVGVDDIIVVTIRELDAHGPTGIEHTVNRLTARNFPALLNIAAALEEHLA